MDILNIILPILCSICSILLILGPHLYALTQSSFYAYLTIISTAFLIYIIYWLYIYNFSIIVITVFGKIIPTVVLSLISLFVIKNDKITMGKIFGLIIVVIGMFMLV